MRSYATLLWNSTDISRLRQIHTISYPDIEYIKDIYQKVFIYLNIPYEEGSEKDRELLLEYMELVGNMQYRTTQFAWLYGKRHPNG